MNNAAILLVEDNAEIMKANRRMLELRGYGVRTAASLAEAGRAIAEAPPDLMVLDIMLPDGSGLDFCRQLRGNAAGIPILFLTVLNENSDVVAGLRAGGDDYLTKPYDYDVLMARIEALLRRARRDGASGPLRAVGPFAFDHTAHRVYRDGRDTLLKPREYALFRLLMENPGVFFPAEVLFRRVWASDPAGDLRTVYAHVSCLRKKLALRDGDGLFLEQRRGQGYRLVITPE